MGKRGLLFRGARGLEFAPEGPVLEGGEEGVGLLAGHHNEYSYIVQDA